jgi:hypothetical protein
MKPLSVNATFNTPTIKLNPEDGYFLIEGRSIPEDPGIFFEHVLNWVEEYFINPAQTTRIEIKLEYVNSGSSKYLLEFFRIIGRNYKEGHHCQVIWYYEEEDEAIQDLGEHYKSTINVPFRFEILEEDEEEE